MKMTRPIPSQVQLMWELTLGEETARKSMKLIKRWITDSGLEWCVKRLKNLRVGAIHLRSAYFAESPEKDPSFRKAVNLWQNESIAYNKSTGFPKGPLGFVVELYARARRPSSVRRMDALLRTYTAFYCKSLTKAQRRKALKAITDPLPEYADPGVLQRWEIRLEHEASRLARVNKSCKRDLPVPNLQRLHASSACHVPPSLKKGEFNRKEFERVTDRSGRTRLVRRSLSDTIYFKLCHSLITSIWLPNCLKELNPNEELREVLALTEADEEIAGHIAFIQEGGAKARVVAVPNAWIQWLMEPLHQWLDLITQSLAESTVHDQNNGAYFMQEHLNQQNELWCFDLSSATDRFPRSLQMRVLDGLGLHSYAQAVDEISSAKWDFDGDIISYRVGQPMGVYGSFPLFHLTHYLILKRICRDVARSRGMDIGWTAFRVQGDDVIIADEEVAGRYQRTLNSFGVEISPVKTIESAAVGEFAGFITTRSNRANYSFSYRPYKYTKVTKAERRRPHLLNLCTALGRKYRLLTGAYYRKVDYDVFAKTLPDRNPDLSPLLPEDEDENGSFPTRLSQQLLGSHFNVVTQRLGIELAVDPTYWKSCRLVFIGQPALTDAELESPYSSYSASVRKGLVHDVFNIGAETLKVSEDDREKSRPFQTHSQLDSLYKEKLRESDRPNRGESGLTNIFGSLSENSGSD